MQFPRALPAWAAIAASLLLGACHSMAEQLAVRPTAHVVSLDSLAIPVSAKENRAVSFTNKRSAFYYTQTHRNDHPEHTFNAAGDILMVEQTAGSLVVQQISAGGDEREPVTVTLAPLRLRREQQARVDAILAGTEFAKPGVAAAHPAMQRSRTP